MSVIKFYDPYMDKEDGFVLSADYDALAALVDRIEADCKAGLHDCSFLASNPPQNPAAFHVLQLIRAYRAKG